MAYELRVTCALRYLHAVVTGDNARETVMRYLRDIQCECVAQQRFCVRIEERLDGARLNAADVFDIAAQGSAQAVGVIRAVADVDVNAEGHLMQLAEDVAVNGGLRVAVFPTVAAAERWLLLA